MYVLEDPEWLLWCHETSQHPLKLNWGMGVVSHIYTVCKWTLTALLSVKYSVKLYKPLGTNKGHFSDVVLSCGLSTCPCVAYAICTLLLVSCMPLTDKNCLQLFHWDCFGLFPFVSQPLPLTCIHDPLAISINTIKLPPETCQGVKTRRSQLNLIYRSDNSRFNCLIQQVSSA